MASANYAVQATFSTSQGAVINAQAAGTIQLHAANANGTLTDAPIICVSILGENE